MALPGLYDCFQHWGEKNAVWVISDTHFGDKDIQKAFPNRPSDEELIKNINQKVGKTGTLLLLGDVGDIECAKQLKGYKVLICGNHESGLEKYKEVFRLDKHQKYMRYLFQNSRDEKFLKDVDKYGLLKTINKHIK